MYVGKIFDKTIRFNNRDYKALKKKWHPDNVRQVDFSSRVTGSCTLCSTFYNGEECPGCPLSIFHDDSGVGCGILLKRLFPNKLESLGFDKTEFKTKKSTTRQYMQKLQDILDTFKKEDLK